MTTPRTVSGQALLSGMRPHLKRAFGPTILRIEAEAIAPYLAALREVDRILVHLNADDAGSAAVTQAEAARQLLRPLLAQPDQDGQASATIPRSSTTDQVI